MKYGKIFRMKKEYLIYLIIMVLQIAVIVFWANSKVNYFSDEFMTMGYTRGITGLEPTAQYITVSPEWTYNEWHQNSEFKSQLLMTDKTALWNLPLFEAVKLLFTGRNYFVILNLVESILGFNEVSNIPAVLLNSVLLVITEVALISLMDKLSMSLFTKCLGISLLGFSSYFVSMTCYVRFYMLVTTLQVLMLNQMYKYREDVKLSSIILRCLCIFALAYLSLRNSELTAPYFGCLSLVFIISLIAAKKWKQLITYCTMCAVGGFYILRYTGYIQTILNPEGKTGMVAEIASAIGEDTLDFVRTYKDWVLDLLSDQLFGHNRVFLLCAIALTGFTLWKLCKPDGESSVISELRIKTLSIIILLGWIFLLYIAEYRNKGVLLSKAGLALTIIWIGFEMLWKKIEIKRIKVSSRTGFVIVMFVAAFLYTCFTSLPHLRIWRYSCFMVTTLIVVLWYTVDRLLKKSFMEPAVCGWQAILIAFTIFGICTPFMTKSIYYIYEEDKGFIETVKEYGEMDVILFSRPYEGQYDQYVYDCVNIMPNMSQIYLVEDGNYSFEDVDFSDEFIYWDHQRDDASDFISEIERRGYDVLSLGKDHVSQAYYCKYNS